MSHHFCHQLSDPQSKEGSEDQSGIRAAGGCAAFPAKEAEGSRVSWWCSRRWVGDEESGAVDVGAIIAESRAGIDSDGGIIQPDQSGKPHQSPQPQEPDAHTVPVQAQVSETAHALGLRERR